MTRYHIGLTVILLLNWPQCGLFFRSVTISNRVSIPTASALFYSASSASIEQTDVIVIGSGLAGLSCGALLSATENYEVTVLESHDYPGGCAHGWTRLGYHFESGPSLYSGFSQEASANPLASIFKIIGESPEWLTYDRWGTVLPEGTFATKIGPDEFEGILERFGGPGAQDDWHRLMAEMLKPGGISDAAQALSPLSLREDAGVVVTLARNLGGLSTAIKQGQALNDPFSTLTEKLNITNKFVLNWLDLLTFLLQGLPSEGCMNAVIGYMLKDWYTPNVCLDFPKGGSSEIIQALIRGVEKKGRGKVFTGTHVEEIIIEGGKAVGVRCRHKGKDRTIMARKAIVSNCDLTMTRKLVPRGAHDKLDQYLDRLNAEVPLLKSFIHLHAGIDATDLPSVPSASLPAQWAVVNNWEETVEAPRNVVLVSVPSLIDPTLCPPGKHIIHAYVPATEAYADWEGMDRTSIEYMKKKDDAADFLWSAVEKYIPNARMLSDKRVEQIGTPLTHGTSCYYTNILLTSLILMLLIYTDNNPLYLSNRCYRTSERFLRRSRGSYGPRIPAGSKDLPPLPSHKTPCKGLFLCGDFSFPGIGVPAAAASGAVTANSIMTLSDHLGLLSRANL